MSGSRLPLLASILVALSACASRPPITERPGLEREISATFAKQLADGPKMLIGVGEIHGTNEAPQFVGALARHFTERGYRVVVLLEEPPEQKPFYTATSLEEAEDRLKKSPFWSGALQDGRAGIANACLRLELAKLSPMVKLVAVDAPVLGLNRDDAMAEHIVSTLATERGEKIAAIYWAGNFHVIQRPAPLGRSALDSAAARLAGFKVLRIDLAAHSGSAFNCQRAQCQSHPISGLPSAQLGFAEDGPGAWLYTFDRFSPQPPAIVSLAQGLSLRSHCEG